MIAIGPLQPADRAAWERLFRGYIAFYKRDLPQTMYDRAWREFQTGTRMQALGARIDGRLAGLVHFLVHANTTAADVCYLQDLFTDEAARGKGIGRALIAAVADWARAHKCARVYWHTHETNAQARILYDKVAENRGFIRYQIELST